MIIIQDFDHEDIHCRKTTVSVFKFKLNVYLYFVDELLIDTGPMRVRTRIGGKICIYSMKYLFKF